jgi:hypothetical protein
MKAFIIVYISIYLISLHTCDIYRTIFSNQIILDYLHPELKERQILYLVKNDYCFLNDHVKDIKILTVDERTAVAHKNYIKLVSVNEQQDKSVDIKLIYPIEGATFLIKTEGGKIVNIDVYEK